MRNRLALIAVAISFPAIAQTIPVNPVVRQETIRATICTPGWTKTVRPPTSYTNALKRKRLAAAGQPIYAAGKYELDHVVPLNLGGAPRDPNNLRLQPWPEARIKDHVEDCLSRKVCRGEIPLDTARNQIWTNWRATACGAR